MKTLVQLAVGFGVSGAFSHLVWETPFYNAYIIGPVFVGAMFLTALVQHRWQFRRRRR